MMRFPLRLTADITKARLAKILGIARDARPIQFLDAAEILHQDSSHPVSHEKIREINLSRSPVVWIGGSEPLLHPGIAHLVRAVTQTGHFVFLETDGTLLRRRIHEFQPVPRLFLTVRLQPTAKSHTPNGIPADAFELAVEGIRAARLSGFLLCGHSQVRPETELRHTSEVIQFAQSLDVDGIVVTSAKDASNPAYPDTATLQHKTAEVRKLVGSNWWESFSRMVEPVLSARQNSARNRVESRVHLEQESPSDKEGVRIA
jgi:MoaA/NifB/PqqE/SkfB family radical SAM enzyme